MDEIFQKCTLPEVRQRFKQLGSERKLFEVESSLALGAAYPEILGICDQISVLCKSAASHELALSKLSSVETLRDWRRISESTEKYYKQEVQIVRQQAIADLVVWVRGQIERLVAEEALLSAARYFYLLSALEGTGLSPIASLDSCLDAWLLKSSDSLDSIMAYILRYQVPPSTVAERLAKSRVIQLRELPVLEAVRLMDQTLASLDYISDYQVKMEASDKKSKLIDVISIERSILPPSALELPLYPECFSQRETFERGEFIRDAEDTLYKSVETFLNDASSQQIIDLYSSLARDSPDLAAKTHLLAVGRLQQLVENTTDSIRTIEVPAVLDQPRNSKTHDMDSIILQVRGQCGTLEGPLATIYQWKDDISQLKEQISGVRVLETRMPTFKGVADNLQNKLELGVNKALEDVFARIVAFKNHSGAIVIMQALDKDSPLLLSQYQQLAESLVSGWQIDTSPTTLNGFPSRGLLKSLKSLVDLMDEVAVGFIWSEHACKALRKCAIAKLERYFVAELPFVCELFGEEYEVKPQVESEVKIDTNEPDDNKRTKKAKKSKPEMVEIAGDTRDEPIDEPKEGSTGGIKERPSGKATEELEKSTTKTAELPEMSEEVASLKTNTESTSELQSPFTAQSYSPVVARVRNLLIPLAV